MELSKEQIEEIVNKINNKEATRNEIAESFGMSDSTLSRRIKNAGYVYSNSTKQYSFASSNPENQEVNKPINKEENKEESNPTNKQEKKQVKKTEIKKENKQEKQEVRKPKKVTYEIDENLHYELRMLGFRQKKNVSEIVEQAIRQYLNK